MNRAKNRQLPKWSVAALLLAAALPILGMLVPNTGIAADVYVAKSGDGDYVRLYDEPCSVSSGWLKLKKAEWFYQGKLYQACWSIHREAVIVLDEQGATAPIHVGRFQKENKT